MGNAGKWIRPVGQDTQRSIVQEVERYLVVAEQHFCHTFPMIPVIFDLKGKAAGMYRVSSQQRVIRFNPWLFAKYPDDSWQNTIPHEVAHYIADSLYGLGRIKPHGKEWRKIMQELGAEPVVRADYDLQGIPVRQIKRYRYHCACREVSLSSYRHNRIQQSKQRYRCRDCGAELQFILP